MSQAQVDPGELLRVAFRRFWLLFYQFETTLQQAYRFPMCTPPQRLLGGEPKVPDGARVIAAVAEMAGELIRIRIGQGTICLFEFLAYEPGIKGPV